MSFTRAVGPSFRAAIAVSVLLVGAVLVVPATRAAAGCSVTYAVVNQWNNNPTSGGFQTNLTITNTGPEPINGWTLTFAFPSSQTITGQWNAAFTQDGASVTASSNQSWNATIAPGESVSSVGFLGSWSGTNGVPSSYAVNGTVCGGGASTTDTQAAVAQATNTPAPAATAPAAPTDTPPLGAQHLDNPFVGAAGFVNPAWKANVEKEATNAASAGNATLAAKMRAISNTSTAVWMDRIAAVNGTDGGPGLAGYLDAALTQMQQAGRPLTISIVIYDLPGRDCNALASNGELPATAAGLAAYKAQYIDPIAATMSLPRYSNLRIVTIIEPDSLPNVTTNSSVPTCATAAPFYEQGVAYALDKLHAIANVYTYVDAAHAGWLGWPNNTSGAVNEFLKVAKLTAAGVNSIDGFITDTANTTPLREPFFTGQTAVSGKQVMSGAFYEANPDADEATYSNELWTQLTQPGRFPSTLGMLMDTSRNGWGCTVAANCPITSTDPPAGALRPTAVSTSTDLTTFINESRVDRRPHRGAWCNQNGAGMGERPTTAPTGFPHMDAFVWIKPPGESDGASQPEPNDQGKDFDRMCDPTYNAPGLKGAVTNALPNAPLAGQWFPAQFVQLVENAFPPI